jgi:hypothetical protein
MQTYVCIIRMICILQGLGEQEKSNSHPVQICIAKRCVKYRSSPHAACRDCPIRKTQGTVMTFLVEGLTSSLEPARQVRRVGEYAALEDAIAAAKEVIDQFLMREFVPGMPPAKLFARYQSAGEVPIIFRDDDDKTLNVTFNHFEYALARCADLAVPGNSPSSPPY